MKEQRASGREPRNPERNSPPAEAPELPTGKAFVLQLSRDTGPSLEPFTGRVEHLASGRRVRFENFAAFRAAVIRLLSEGRGTRDEGDPR